MNISLFTLFEPFQVMQRQQIIIEEDEINSNYTKPVCG
jgi:hypothetical protein